MKPYLVPLVILFVSSKCTIVMKLNEAKAIAGYKEQEANER